MALRQWLVLSAVFLCVNSEITVIRLVLHAEQEVSVAVNRSVEYMLDFTPSYTASFYQSRVRLRTEGGDPAHPVLFTARQRTGALTWQVPYVYHGRLFYEKERMLCLESYGEDVGASNCSQSETFIPNAFSLHVSSACSSSVLVHVTAGSATDWALSIEAPRTSVSSERAPSLQYYLFAPEQDVVRVVMESADDVCATVLVQNYSTCPIAHTEQEIFMATIRMSMQRSGGLRLGRDRFPVGFYVTTIVQATDAECDGEVGEDWTWSEAWAGRDEPARVKTITTRVQAALTPAQYALASAAMILAFLLFYVGVLAAVLAQRVPCVGRCTRPKAVLAESSPALERPRSRRLSQATFDSRYDSDSDEDLETAPAAATAPAATFALNKSTSALNKSTSALNKSSSALNASSPALNASSPALTTSSSGVDSPPAPADESASVPSSTPVPIFTVTSPDSEPTEAHTAETTDTQAPYGLPLVLTLAATARRRARVLAARSDRYLHITYTVALFYALPVVQFVTAFQIVMNVSGSLDLCYYNFLCAHGLGGLADFNHVLSNAGYLLLGALLLLQLRRRRRRRRRYPRHEEYGIPPHDGLLSALGCGMMVVGVLSASYHICPNRLNFQFDMAFMYVLAVVSMVSIYQSRHPDVNARAHATFATLAVLMIFVLWGVLGGSSFFWAVWSVLHLVTVFLLSLRIYYVGQFRLEKGALAQAARELATLPRRGVRPLYRARLLLLAIANAVNWASALYGLWKQSTDFASHLLELLLMNVLLYMLFYIAMKLVHGERPRWYSWCFLAGAAVAWAPALYYFASGSSDWSTTPARSRHLNHECKLLQFYDSHDLWHMLSAVALYLSFSAMMTWDDGLAAVRRADIAVF